MVHLLDQHRRLIRPRTPHRMEPEKPALPRMAFLSEHGNLRWIHHLLGLFRRNAQSDATRRAWRSRRLYRGIGAWRRARRGDWLRAVGALGGSAHWPTLNHHAAPWQFLYFFPDPHGHGSLRPTLGPTWIGANFGACPPVAGGLLPDVDGASNLIPMPSELS